MARTRSQEVQDHGGQSPATVFLVCPSISEDKGQEKVWEVVEKEEGEEGGQKGGQEKQSWGKQLDF